MKNSIILLVAILSILTINIGQANAASPLNFLLSPIFSGDMILVQGAYMGPLSTAIPVTWTDSYTGQKLTIHEDNAVIYWSQYMSSSTSKPTGVILYFSCDSINSFNQIHHTNLTDAIILALVYTKDNIDTNIHTDLGIKPEYNYQTSRQIFIPILGATSIETTQIMNFEGSIYYKNQICNIVTQSPSEKDDMMVDYDYLKYQTEVTMADYMKNETQIMYTSIGNMFSMIEEIALVLYWIIKILISIFVISMIFWIFIWFYKLIKKLLGEL